MCKITFLQCFGPFSLLTDCVVTYSESCAITPINRPQMGNGQPLPYETESVGGRTTTSDGEQGLTMARTIDWCLGLNVSWKDRDIISKVYGSGLLLDEDDHSLNQTRAFISQWSLFVDFKIKKNLSVRDPKVQLAIWNCATLIRKQRHGWDTSFPVPAIAVYGSHWDLYLFFEMKGDLVSYLKRSSLSFFEAMLTKIDTDNDGSDAYGLYKRSVRTVGDYTSAAYSY